MTTREETQAKLAAGHWPSKPEDLVSSGFMDVGDMLLIPREFSLLTNPELRRALMRWEGPQTTDNKAVVNDQKPVA